MISQFFLGFLAGIFLLLTPAMSLSSGSTINEEALFAFLTCTLLMFIVAGINMWVREPARLRINSTDNNQRNTSAVKRNIETRHQRR